MKIKDYLFRLFLRVGDFKKVSKTKRWDEKKS